MRAGSIRELLCFDIHLEQVQNELQPVSGVSKFPGLAPFQTDEMQDKAVQDTNTTLRPSSSLLYGKIFFLQWLRGASDIFLACCKTYQVLRLFFPGSRIKPSK